jgi:hypothetical protein
VTIAFRVGSFAMMLFLAVPMVRDCCLPLTSPPPCHQSKQTDDMTCASSLQAITQDKTAAVRLSPADGLPVMRHAEPVLLPVVSRSFEKNAASPPPLTNLYLRTGALLI